MERSAKGSNLHLTLVTPITAIIAALMLLLGSYGVVAGLAATSGDDRPAESTALTDDGSHYRGR